MSNELQSWVWCGGLPELQSEDGYLGKLYAYFCKCGVVGFAGKDPESAVDGWNAKMEMLS